MLPHTIMLAVLSSLLAQGNIVQALPSRPHQTRSEYLGGSEKGNLDAAPQPRSLNPTNNAVLETRDQVLRGFLHDVAAIGNEAAARLVSAIEKKHEKVTNAVEAAKEFCRDAVVWVRKHKSGNADALEKVSAREPQRVQKELKQMAVLPSSSGPSKPVRQSSSQPQPSGSGQRPSSGPYKVIGEEEKGKEPDYDGRYNPRITG